MPSTKENIISLPNIHLRQLSQAVTVIDSKIQKVVEDMISATLDWDKSREHEVGVALAAIQIDKKYKIVIVRKDFEDKKNKEFNVYINPTIIKLYGSKTADYEGCLSVDSLYGKVPRYTKVDISAMDLTGKINTFTYEGFLARVLQHEIDHTNGILFIDKIKNRKKAFFNLNDSGKLEPIIYEQIKKNNLLW